NHTDCPLTDFGGKTSIFSHPVYLFLRKFSLQDSRGGSVIVHIKGMASSELFENILSGDSLVVRIIPALLAGVVMSRIITRLPGLDISCPETDSLS
ncbi:hypothetical protein ACP80Y_17090, partial [Escherichia coli]